MKRIGALLCVALFMTACFRTHRADAGLDKLALRKAEQDLSSGIRAYEDGGITETPLGSAERASEGLSSHSDKSGGAQVFWLLSIAPSRGRNHAAMSFARRLNSILSLN